MGQFAFFAQLRAKPGKEAELASLIEQGDAQTQADTDIVQSFSMKTPDGTYCLFDIFVSEGARDAHFHGETARALAEQTSSLLSEPPAIQLLEIVRRK